MSAITFAELVSQYSDGRRDFRSAEVTGHAANVDLSAIDLTGARLEGISLDSVILRSANLSKACIKGIIRTVDLTGADLSESEFAVIAGYCNLEGVILRSAKLRDAQFVNGRFFPAAVQGADLSGARFHDVSCRGVILSNVNCSGAVFTDCDFTDATLIGTSFHEAGLSGSCFRRARLKGANLLKADLRFADLSGSLCRDADFRGATLTSAKFMRADLGSANLRGAELTKGNLRGADLTGADLEDADLHEAVVTNANFSGANLTRATLEFAAAVGTNFSRAVLEGSNFQRSLLSGADFASASTTGAHFWEAELEHGALSTEQLKVVSTTWKALDDLGGRVVFHDNSGDRVTHTVVRIFFATDRARVTGKEGSISYGDCRNENRDSPLEFGTCEVSVPRDHRMGKLEAPSIWRLEIKWKADKHILVTKTDPCDSVAFWQSIGEQIEIGGERQILLFVHGFNVSFADAARRCAQMSYDLAFDGAAIVYSWPSKATIPGYPADEESVEWSADHLRCFIEQLAAFGGVSSLHIVAHSMGNRAVMRAMERLRHPVDGEQRVLANIALTAPDVDAGVFVQVAPNIIPRAGTITLYASDNDRALKISRDFHAYRRAGEAGERILVLPGIATIDVTSLDTDFLGHSYFGDNRSVISDIFYLIRGNGPSARHGLREVFANGVAYWKFQP